jgi:hemerythrin-like domain-containing protein
MPQATETTSIIEMLREDHERVKDLFEQFEQAGDSRTKQRIVETALLELEVHAALEESLIYPVVREEIDEEDLMDEALEEHHVAKMLIRELKRMKPSDERFDAKFSVLGESVKHHIEEEEKEMLPKAEQADIEWASLEGKVMKRREQLMERFASGRSAKRGRSRRTGRRRS